MKFLAIAVLLTILLGPFAGMAIYMVATLYCDICRVCWRCLRAYQVSPISQKKSYVYGLVEGQAARNSESDLVAGEDNAE